MNKSAKGDPTQFWELFTVIGHNAVELGYIEHGI